MPITNLNETSIALASSHAVLICSGNGTLIQTSQHGSLASVNEVLSVDKVHEIQYSHSPADTNCIFVVQAQTSATPQNGLCVGSPVHTTLLFASSI